MSTTTDVLSLFKYDPVADADSTFNITQGLNNNWDKLDAALLLAIAAAGAYNPEESYAVGDYCTYKGKLHKCSTAIPTGETWTEAHWTTTTVAAELAELSSQLSNALRLLVLEAGEETDLNALPEQAFFCMTSKDAVVGLPEGWPSNRNDFIRFYNGNLAYTLDLIANYGNKRLAYRLATGNWAEIATATPPQKFTAPLSDGYSGALSYLKTQESIVIVSFDVYKTDNSTINGTNLISTLPEGFRGVSGYCVALATGVGGGSVVGAAQAWCDTEGIVRTLCPSGTYRIRGEIIFCAN